MKSSNFSNTAQSEIKLLLLYLNAGLDFQQVRDIINIEQASLKEYALHYYNESMFEVLSNYFSYKDLLNFIYETKSFEKKLKQETIKVFTYPLILYLLMYSLMLFFIIVLVPSLMNIITLFDISLTTLFLTRNILITLFVLLTLLNGAIISFTVLHLNEERCKVTINKLTKNQKFSILNEIITYQFAHMFNLLLSHGFSTKQALDLMRRGSENKRVSWLATLVTYNLEQGIPFEKSIELHQFDISFLSLLKLGIMNNQVTQLLITYLETTETKVFIKLKRIGSIIKLLTYTLIAILIIFMYQILLTPMSMMGSL